jgi:LysM repeat protein
MSPWRGRLQSTVAFGAALWLALAAAGARADSGMFHIVRQGDTLASIAERYYGDPQRETILVVENGLIREGGSEIVVGMRLIIPTVIYYRVQEGETWAELAKRFYGDARRAYALFEANRNAAGAQPDPGYELLIPYPLRYVVSQNDTLRQIAKKYYPYNVDQGIKNLVRFNFMRTARVDRGQIVLVPLENLALSGKGRKTAEPEGKPPIGGEIRDKQEHISAELVVLHEHLLRGRFAEAVALGNRLLGGGDLSGNQLVTVHRELAVAYVAFGREDLAVQAFKTALQKQPDLELDTVTTSPKVLHALARARPEPKPSEDKSSSDSATKNKKPPPSRKRAR